MLSSRLAGTSHNPDKMSVISKEIADEIKQNLRGMSRAPVSAKLDGHGVGYVLLWQRLQAQGLHKLVSTLSVAQSRMIYTHDIELA